MSKTLCVSVPDEMRDTLDKMAKEEERNLSFFVRKAIEEYLEKRQQNTEK